MYRKLTRKVIEIIIEGANASRELAKQCGNPNDAHWVELGGFVGYLNRHKKMVKLTYCKPRDLRVLSNIDSNYATDKETCRSVSKGNPYNWRNNCELAVKDPTISHSVQQ
jgi:hypothetical protein